MIWLHTYSGLYAGWLIFAVFLTGTLSYYNQEISHWMTGNTIEQQSQSKLLNHGLETLQSNAPNASQWRIRLPDDRGGQYSVSYREGRERNTIYLNPNNLTEVDEPETRGGNFFRTFHYTLSLRQWGGRYFTGIAAMLMLVAIFTGIYTHRRFFKDFFTLRNKDKLKFTIDFHAISGVITIPFGFMICFSALLIYISMYQPFAINQYYESFRDLDRQVSTRHQTVKASGESRVEPLKIESQLAGLEQKWGKNYQLSSVVINQPNDANAQIIFNHRKNNILSNKAESLAVTEHGLSEIEDERFARMFRRVFYGLHEAHFATPMSRAMFFLLGMFSTVLIATGMTIWLNKRQQKQQKKSYVLVDKVNNAVFYGLTLAIAGYFLASKLSVFSLSLAHLELPIFFYTWLASLILALSCSSQCSKALLLLTNACTYSLLLVIDIFHLFTYTSKVANVPYLTVMFWLSLTAVYFINVSLKNPLKVKKD